MQEGETKSWQVKVPQILESGLFKEENQVEGRHMGYCIKLYIPKRVSLCGTSFAHSIELFLTYGSTYAPGHQKHVTNNIWLWHKIHRVQLRDLAEIYLPQLIVNYFWESGSKCLRNFNHWIILEIDSIGIKIIVLGEDLRILLYGTS